MAGTEWRLFGSLELVDAAWGCLGLDERYWRLLVGTRGSCMENSQQWGLCKGYWLGGFKAFKELLKAR